MLKLESYEFAQLLNSFAFKLYHETRLSDENLVLSPAQMMISLSLLAMGSDSNTEKQFQVLLGYGDPSKLGKCLQQGVKEVLHWVEKFSITSIQIEKSLTIKQTFPLFLKQCGLDYDMFFGQVDFVKGSQAYKNQINEYAVQQLGVQKLIPDGYLNSFVRAVVINSIRYQCVFHTPFSEKLTQQDTFVINNHTTNYKTLLVEVFMMNQIEFYKYFDDKVATFVGIPLKDFRFHLDIIIPKINIKEYEALINYAAYVQYILQSKKTKLHLKLPRFRIQYQQTKPFKDILVGMGLADIFQSMKSDLSKIEKTKSACLSEVLSRPIIEVFEDELSAEQSLELPKYTQPPIVVTVNRPFLYAVRETLTNSILIFGKLIDPTQME
ncbi:proteinase inhibitor I4 serpin (macronuclear) [Tetrahymena thermophila SB210]|uniref:Proteinase inhibitor I4 serpin n=1 Tax=Tetrahymena thermophila (strain SB210) TaxID=312017 RepID=Q22M13_TETTS|nr:proteinase inhibitor I4 serpin [Tetrahymena thermophila SB210]EAR86578.1 proteinase inhibitor I4 serpin [Tetrahymena thermophila SB210]|eukprot:XP_977207.1 proteinase inhibitor I4 serpin [Tetrahymena thermophila SB210]